MSFIYGVCPMQFLSSIKILYIGGLNVCGTCGILCYVLSACDMFGVYVFPRHCGRLKGVCGV